MIPLSEMILKVELYILIRRGVNVHIKIDPTNQKEVNLLGRAYDAAIKYFRSIKYKRSTIPNDPF